MTDNDKNQPSAWVWSQYRSELPPAGAAPQAAQQSAEPTGREHPPLMPEKSGAGVGPALAVLVLIAAGMTWWFSGAQPAKEEAPLETAAPATSEPAIPDEAPSAETATPAAEPTTPAAEPEAKPEPKAETPKHKKKKKQR